MFEKRYSISTFIMFALVAFTSTHYGCRDNPVGTIDSVYNHDSMFVYDTLTINDTAYLNTYGQIALDLNFSRISDISFLDSSVGLRWLNLKGNPEGLSGSGSFYKLDQHTVGS